MSKRSPCTMNRERSSIPQIRTPSALKKREDHFFVWAQKSENRGKISLTPVFPEPQSLTFILAVPLYQEVSDSRHPKPNGRFAGVLAFTLDMKEFLANQLGSVDPKMNLDQVWIMDKDGTLLFQPDHPEMVFRNIYQREGSCRSCHISFNYIEEILIKGAGNRRLYRSGTIRRRSPPLLRWSSRMFPGWSW